MLRLVHAWGKIKKHVLMTCQWLLPGRLIDPYVTPDSERTVLLFQNEPKHYLA